MGALSNTIARADFRHFWVELATVVPMDAKGLNICGVQCRDDPNAPPEKDFWNTATVKVRAVKNQDKPDEILHYYCMVLQQYSQKWAGHPYMPRIGDMVLVLFSLNQKPMILGTIYTDVADPVCRAPFDPKPESWTIIDARYDDVNKWCQWQIPTFDDKSKEVIYNKLPEHPICDKKFHKYRDQIKVTDCREGHRKPCHLCKTLDCIKRPVAQWEKIYSDITCSADYEHPYIPGTVSRAKRRHEWHEPSGSYFVFQNNTNDADYGKGLIRLENATAENAMKGHINFRPSGTIDMHGDHNSAAVSSETTGNRIMAVANGDTSFLQGCELIQLDTGAYVRVMKDGSIDVYSPLPITATSDVQITAKAPYIKLDGNVEITGDLKIDGACSHGACSCLGAQDFTASAYVETDPNNKITVVPTTVSCTSMACDESCYLVADEGTDYFDDCQIAFDCSASSCDSGGCGGCCGLSNTGNTDLLSCTGYKLVTDIHATDKKLRLALYNGSTIVTSQEYTINLGQIYYCTLARPTGTTTATLKIYSDQNHKTLLTTLTITNTNLGSKYRYLYTLSSMNNGTSPEISMAVSNVIIQSH